MAKISSLSKPPASAQSQMYRTWPKVKAFLFTEIPFPFKQKIASSHSFTEDGIRARAQQVYERRIAQGLKGTPEKDWQKAIKELKWEQSLLGRIYLWMGMRQKTGWDLVQLLANISIPIVIFAGGSLFSYLNDQQQQRIADDKARQEALVKYLDQMGDALKDGLLAAKPGAPKFIIAQSKTVTVLQSLDKRRQQLVIQFLTSSGLSQAYYLDQDSSNDYELGKGDRALLYKARMKKANLANSDLSGANLIEVDLSYANLGCAPPDSKIANQCSDLSSTDLRGADLSYADLSYANLTGANSWDADFRRATFRGANLYRSDFLRADLTDADLTGADLTDINLTGANLTGANLTGANLRGATLDTTDLTNVTGWTDEQLGKAHLCFATLPKGSKLDKNQGCGAITLPL